MHIEAFVRDHPFLTVATLITGAAAVARAGAYKEMGVRPKRPSGTLGGFVWDHPVLAGLGVIAIATCGDAVMRRPPGVTVTGALRSMGRSTHLAAPRSGGAARLAAHSAHSPSTARQPAYSAHSPSTARQPAYSAETQAQSGPQLPVMQPAPSSSAPATTYSPPSPYAAATPRYPWA